MKTFPNKLKSHIIDQISRPPIFQSWEKTLIILCVIKKVIRSLFKLHYRNYDHCYSNKLSILDIRDIVSLLCLGLLVFQSKYYLYVYSLVNLKLNKNFSLFHSEINFLQSIIIATIIRELVIKNSSHWSEIECSSKLCNEKEI